MGGTPGGTPIGIIGGEIGGAPIGGTPGGAPIGTAANSVCGRVTRFGFCAASRRSAAVPCRSPLVSFFSAYETLIGCPARNCPFIVSIARSEDSKLS
jgi:hypothetical protein